MTTPLSAVDLAIVWVLIVALAAPLVGARLRRVSKSYPPMRKPAATSPEADDRLSTRGE